MLPGEHHFFMDTYHNKSNYEFNWIYGELMAGHEYRLGRAESSGFLGGTTLWVLRDITTDDTIAESVDCHDDCSILEYLRRMHVQDRDVRPLELRRNLLFLPASSFSKHYVGTEGEKAAQLSIISTYLEDALLASDIPMVASDPGPGDLILAVESLTLSFWAPGLSAEFEAYGLDGDFQATLTFDAVLSTPDGTELDRWFVAAIGESSKTGMLFYEDETYQKALVDAADRISDGLVYDLKRRFDSIERQNVLSRSQSD